MRHRKTKTRGGVTGDMNAYEDRGRSTGDMRSEENQQTVRLIRSSRHAAKMAAASVGSTAQRKATELGHNQPDNHLRERTCQG